MENNLQQLNLNPPRNDEDYMSDYFYWNLGSVEGTEEADGVKLFYVYTNDGYKILVPSSITDVKVGDVVIIARKPIQKMNLTIQVDEIIKVLQNGRAFEDTKKHRHHEARKEEIHNRKPNDVG